MPVAMPNIRPKTPEELDEHRRWLVGDKFERVIEGADGAYKVFVRSSTQATAFAGKAKRPSFHMRFGSEERMNQFVQDWVAAQERSIASKKARKAAKKAALSGPRKLKVGDVLYSSWGYEQTNIDFYQVVGLVGKRTLELRKIAGRRTTDLPDQGDVVPVPNQFVGEVFRKRENEHGGVSINSYSSASKMEPIGYAGGAPIFQPKRWSSYH